MVTNLGDVVDGLVRSRGIEASSVRNSFEMKTKWVSALRVQDRKASRSQGYISTSTAANVCGQEPITWSC